MRSADVAVSRGWYGDAGANERLRSHLNQEWETREAAQRRNPKAFSGPAPEIRLKSVADQERRGVVAEVVARGEIAPPSAHNPRTLPSAPERPSSLFSGEQVRDQPSRGNQGGVAAFANPGQSVPSSKGARSAGDLQAPELERAPGRTAPGVSSNPPSVEPVRPAGSGRSPTGVSGLSGGAGGAFPNGAPSAGTSLRNEGGTFEPNAGASPTRNESGRVPNAPGVQNGGRPLTDGVPSRSGNTRPQTLPREETPGGISGLKSGGRTESGRSGVQAPTAGAVGGNGGRTFPSNTGANFPGGNPSQGGVPSMRQDGLSTQRVPSQGVQQPPSQQSILGNPPRTVSPATQQFPQQAPVSGARSTVVPSPATVPQAPAPAAFSGPRVAPQGGGSGGVPGRSVAPVGNPPPSGSGVSMGTTPASGTPAQPAQKKKPGDPGYVPGQ